MAGLFLQRAMCVFVWVAGEAWAVPVVVPLAGGEPVVRIQPEEGDTPVDVRLVRVDPATGLRMTSPEVSLGCRAETGAGLQMNHVAAGEQVTLMLPPALPMGSYRVQAKPADANGGWAFVGPSLQVAMEPLHRVSPCPQGASLRLDLQPLFRAGVVDAQGATVSLRAAELAGQGVRVNHAGWVITSSALPADTGAVQGLVRWHGGVREASVAYEMVESWDGLSLLVPVGGEGDGLVDAPHARWMDASMRRGSGEAVLRFEHSGRLYAVRRGTQELVPVQVLHERGEVIDAGVPVELVGDLRPTDVGSPVIDHAGRVWGLVTSPGSAIWSVTVLRTFDERSKQQVGALTMNAPEVP